MPRVVLRLQPDPEPNRMAKTLCKSRRKLAGNRALLLDNFLEHVLRHVEIASKSRQAKVAALEEIVAQDLARMRRTLVGMQISNALEHGKLLPQMIGQIAMDP